MDLVLMESFVAVCDAGTISGAAQELHLSQSALSRRLQQLEDQLEAKLLIRSREGIELTEAGHEVLLVGRRILDQHRRMCRDLDQRNALTRGHVRVGGGATAASMLLPSCIAELHASHPGLTFYVREAGSNQVAADVAHGKLDLGVITSPVDVPGVEAEHLLSDEIVLVAPTAHRLTRGRHDPEALNGSPLIAFESASAIRRVIDASLTGAGIDMPVVAELRSIPTMLKMVYQTGIPAFVSRLAVDGEQNLSEIKIRGLQIERELAIATRRDVPLTPAAAVFEERLRGSAAVRP